MKKKKNSRKKSKSKGNKRTYMNRKRSFTNRKMKQKYTKRRYTKGIQSGGAGFVLNAIGAVARGAFGDSPEKDALDKVKGLSQEEPKKKVGKMSVIQDKIYTGDKITLPTLQEYKWYTELTRTQIKEIRRYLLTNNRNEAKRFNDNLTKSYQIDRETKAKSKSDKKQGKTDAGKGWDTSEIEKARVDRLKAEKSLLKAERQKVEEGRKNVESERKQEEDLIKEIAKHEKDNEAKRKLDELNKKLEQLKTGGESDPEIILGTPVDPDTSSNDNKTKTSGSGDNINNATQVVNFNTDEGGVVKKVSQEGG